MAANTNTNTSTPVFHRAHYNIVAAVFRRYLQDADKTNKELGMELDKGVALLERAIVVTLVLQMSKRLAEDNPLFDEARFFKASVPPDSLKGIVLK